MLNRQFFVHSVCVGILLLLSGCQNNSTLYYWGDYQENLYNYTQLDKTGFNEQIQALELTVEKAKSANKALPPGLHAQLGLLYANVGNPEKAFEQFEIEKSLFPESKNFIDFVESKYRGH